MMYIYISEQSIYVSIDEAIAVNAGSFGILYQASISSRSYGIEYIFCMKSIEKRKLSDRTSVIFIESCCLLVYRQNYQPNMSV